MGDPVRRNWVQSVWSLAAFAALLVGLVAWWGWAPGVGADTALGTTGLTGNHFLFDEAGQPGAQCDFHPETQAVTFTVTAPFVVGLNRDPVIVEATAVSWNVVLLRDGVVIDESGRQYGMAGEIGSATFQPIVIVSPARTGLLSIQVEIQWLDFPEMPQETVLGSSLREVDFYRQELNDDTGPRTVEDGCRVAEEPTPIPTDTPAPTSTPIPPAATNTSEPTATTTPEPTSTATATPVPASTATGTP